MITKKIWKTILLIVLILILLAALVPYAVMPVIARHHSEIPKVDWKAAKGERATILRTGDDALRTRLSMIDQAQESLIVGTYLFADDESGRMVAAALLDAADRGVSVRILVDGMIGSFNFMKGSLGYQLGTHENVELRLYNPLIPVIFSRINASYHEKYVIMDGKMMVLGGRNISDEFLTSPGHPKYNEDLDVFLYTEEKTDGAVAELISYFERVWSISKPRYTSLPGWRKGQFKRYGEMLENTYTDAYRNLTDPGWLGTLKAECVPIDAFHLIVNPIDPRAKMSEAWDQLMCIARGAKERVYMITPYLVLDKHMRNELTQLGQMDVDAKILTNAFAYGNNIIASGNMMLCRGQIKRLGIPILSCMKPYSMHTKAMLVDHDISIFGSFNYDMRSAYIDTEAMFAIKSAALNQKLEEHFDALTENAAEYFDGQPKVPFFKRLRIHILMPFMALVKYLL